MHGMKLKMDTVGIWLTTLCLIHCLALPFLLALLPFVHHVGHDESVHQLLSVLAIPVALVALIPGYLKHRLLLVPVLGVGGLAMLFSGPWLQSAMLEQALTSGGGALLVGTHLLNRRLTGKTCCKAC